MHLPLPSDVQSPHMHNSVSEDALLLLDVVICMDLKRRWRWISRTLMTECDHTIEACWIIKAWVFDKGDQGEQQEMWRKVITGQGLTVAVKMAHF